MANQSVTIPRDCLPQYDELYSVSDLHLGGPTGFQIFNAGAELAALIDSVRESQAARVAFVVNGDFVDFLAEQPSKYFDAEGAVAKLDRITGDEAFAPVFEALRRFVARPKRYLVINLGNHDLELALPWVRARLLDLLAGDDDAARGRITLSLDGAGFLCRVGNSEVMCVHGNEVDTWNLADYEAIRRLGQEVVHGRPVPAEWIPNAGTKMVIEVMNEVKHDFPFVDLLKPETSGVLPILQALAPLKSTQLEAAVSIAARFGVDMVRRLTGFLGGEDDRAGGPQASAPSLLSALPAYDAAASSEAAPAAPVSVRPAGRDCGQSRREQLAARLLDDAELRLAACVDPLTLVAADQRTRQLGYGQAFVNWLWGEDQSEVVREALEKLRHDRSFEFDEPDKTFEWLDEQIAGNAEFILAGHTHLERALPRRKGRGWYFNSGTWARLIKLDERMLTDSDLFARVFKALGAHSMQALDDFNEEGLPLVMHRLTVVAVCAGDGRTYAELRRVRKTGAKGGGGFAVEVDERTRFPRG
jgi:UDP-2,3-diacylglucosamine pyrophosphatase LpxH